MSERFMGYRTLNRVILTLTVAGASLSASEPIPKPSVTEIEPVGMSDSFVYSGGSCNTDSDCYKSCLPGGPGATGGYTGTCEGLPTSCYKDGTLIEPALTSECYVPPADVKFDPPSIIK